MPRDFSGPWEPEDVFEHAEAAEHRARIDEAKTRNAEIAKQEAEQETQRKEESRAFTLETNERLRLSEFRFHGVQPPMIDGVPTRSSFHMLTSLGWTVEEVFGSKQMVAPPAPATVTRKRREDYDQSS